MNELQKILLETYGGGDYAWLLDDAKCIEGGAPTAMNDEQMDEWLADNAGDTLLLFLFRELSDDGGTENAEYLRRMQCAIGEIETVVTAIEGMA